MSNMKPATVVNDVSSHGVPSGSTQITNYVNTVPPLNRPATIPSHYRGEQLLKINKKDRIHPRLVCLLTPGSSNAESYYRLRHTVENLRDPERGIVIGVTSAGVGDGKTLTAINLAGALARNPATSVLLVDLDLRQQRPGIRDYLDVKKNAAPGVTDWIRNTEMDSAQMTHYIADFNLYLITAGNAVESPYELLKSPRLDDFLIQARLRFDFIILDTTQVLNRPDTQLLSAIVDGFLFVIRADHTPARMIEDSLNLMEQEKCLGWYSTANHLHSETSFFRTPIFSNKHPYVRN